MLGTQRYFGYDQVQHSFHWGSSKDHDLTIASTEVEVSISNGHREIASIVLPATNPNSALSAVKVAKHVVRRTILPNFAGLVIAISKAGVPKSREVRSLSERQEGQT